MQGVACLFIDFQDCFLKAIHGRGALERRVSFVAEACKLLGIKVYFSEQVPEKLGATIPLIKELLPDAPVFAKRSFSVWQQESFRATLEKDEITHLLVGGIETPICVYQTVNEARNDDFAVTVLSDCIGCRRKKDGKVIIRTLLDHGTLCLPSESVFYSILRDVDHPSFRAFTQLVKHYSS
jgi:hypothetical protein